MTGALARLPRRVDVAAAAAAITALDEREWIACPGGHLGETAVPLVAVGGGANFDLSIAGPAGPTAALARLPAVADVMAAVAAPISRARLIRVAAGGDPPFGSEWGYHWFRRAVLCVPLTVGDAPLLECGDEAAALVPGEVWRFDATRRHRLRGGPGVHLIVEARATDVPAAGGTPAIEPYRFEVLDDHEFAALTDAILAEAPDLAAPIDALRRRWRAAFARFGHASAGELAYQDLVLAVREDIAPRLAPGGAAARAAAVIHTMLATSPPGPRRLLRPVARRADVPAPTPTFDRPVFVVSAPRAGSTVLFDLLAALPDVWTIGEESHELIRGVPGLHPATHGWRSDRLTAAEATPAVADALKDRFSARLIDRDGASYGESPPGRRPERVRLVEKTPANALRIPFLRAVFPDARFVDLRRDPRENISSLVEGWRSRRFIAYTAMPGWPHRDWSFLLPPGWEALVDRPLLEIAAHQWRSARAALEADLADLPAERVCRVDYADLVRAPGEVVRAIAAAFDLSLDERAARALAGPLRPSRVTVSAPAPDKWRRHERELAALLADVDGQNA